jgi:hypothetical protein
MCLRAVVRYSSSRLQRFPSLFQEKRRIMDCTSALQKTISGGGVVQESAGEADFLLTIHPEKRIPTQAVCAYPLSKNVAAVTSRSHFKLLIMVR